MAPQVTFTSLESLAMPRSTTATWLAVLVASLAMVATLPGRTHGLGLITEPLLRELQVSRVGYASINLWATLLGALFCLPWGGLIDRCGVRVMLGVTLALLAGVVLAMTAMRGDWPMLGAMPLDLFLLVMLTRGFGQSALSVVSITLVGRLTSRRPGLIIGVYSFLVGVGFSLAFALIKLVSQRWQPDWRELWAGIGWCVLALAPVGWLIARAPGSSPAGRGENAVAAGFTLRQALLSPAFWVFAIATSLYGMIASGMSLFNEAILAERGFDRDVYLTIMAITPVVALASNLASGWLATRWRIGSILGLAMLMLAVALACFPLVRTLADVYVYAAALGVAGGMVTVVFFAVWSQVFGKRHLGQIQGAAQMLTVLGSALGPLLLALCNDRTGSYVPMLTGVAIASALLAVASCRVSMPVLQSVRTAEESLMVDKLRPINGE